MDAAHYALGWTHFKQGNYEAAISEFRQFLSQYRNVDEFVPYRNDALLRLADSYYALKRYPEAVQTYSRIGGEDGNDYALYQVGQAYYNAGEGFEAITTFRRLLRDFPESDWVEESQYNLGYLYFQNQNYEEAITEYQKLIRDYPRDPLAAKAQYGIGDSHFNSGNMEEAVEAYRAVLEKYPNSPFTPDAANGIQIALIALGDDERASDIIESFVESTDSSNLADELRFRQAEAKYQTGQIDEALLDFQRFVRNSENTSLLPDAYFYLGSIFMDRNRPQEAEAYLKRIVTRHPQSPRNADATRKLGELMLEQSRGQEALDTFKSLETILSDNPQMVAEARYGQAQALLLLGRQAEAERLLNELSEAGGSAAQLAPVQLGLGRVYETEGRTQEAVQMYRSVVENNLDATGAEALFRLGELLINLGQERAALEELGKMTVLYGGYSEWVARGFLAQARAFKNLGQRGDALQLYNRVIEEYSGTPYAETAAQEKASL